MKLTGGIIHSLATLYYWWTWVSLFKYYTIFKMEPELDIVGDTRRMQVVRITVIIVLTFVFGLFLVKWAIGLFGIEV
jgi:hypothetical protein